MSTRTRSRTETHTHLPTCRWEVDHARWSCARADRRAAHHAAPELSTMHAVLVAESRRLRDAVAAGQVGVRDAAPLHALTELVGHHLREDGRLVALVGPGQATDLVDDHLDLTLELGAVARTRDAWLAAPSPAGRSALGNHLAHLHDLLREHLGSAHERLLAQAARDCAPEVWASFRRESVADLPGDGDGAAVLAWEDDPAVLDDLLAVAPRTPAAVVPLARARALAGGLSRSRTRPGSR